MGLILPPGMSRRYISIIVLILGSMLIWVAFDQRYRLPDRISWSAFSYGTTAGLPSPGLDVFDFPTVDSESIRSICGASQWNSSVVFKCDESVGGVGNIRNSILNCVRYAISAGGGLVVPSIVLRNSADISNIRTGQKTELSYMFDTQHFLDSLRLSCPELRVYSSIEKIDDFVNAHESINMLPEDLIQEVIPKTGLSEPEKWRGLFYTWLEQYSSPNPGPFVIALGRSYMQYPIYSDGNGFALSFGGILKLRSDVRKLATITLMNLISSISLETDITQPFIKDAFFGAHLRTEKDAQAGWPVGDWIYSRYETQARYYLEQAPRSHSAVIYVASGDLSEVAKFATDAAKINMTVVTKTDLLTGAERAELTNLAWDQQALVDFLVMHKASDFAGVGHSSFAWNIALKRHEYSAVEKHLDGPQILSDELSVLYGLIRGYPEYAACLWP